MKDWRTKINIIIHDDKFRNESEKNNEIALRLQETYFQLRDLKNGYESMKHKIETRQKDFVGNYIRWLNTR